MRKLFAAALTAAVLLAPAAATAAPLHEPHQYTVSECEAEGPVVWHFVHNQVEAASAGLLTSFYLDAGLFETPNGPPFEANVLHYWVTTAGNDTLLEAYDNVEGGNLVLSHIECPVPPTTTTTSSTTTTSTTTTSTTTTTIPTSTTTTTSPNTTTTTTPEETTTTTPSTTTTTTITTTTTTIPELPLTGAGDWMIPLAILGIGLLVLGVAALRGPTRG